MVNEDNQYNNVGQMFKWHQSTMALRSKTTIKYKLRSDVCPTHKKGPSFYPTRTMQTIIVVIVAMLCAAYQ